MKIIVRKQHSRSIAFREPTRVGETRKPEALETRIPEAVAGAPVAEPVPETTSNPVVVFPTNSVFQQPPSRKSIVDDVLKILRKQPEDPLDFITLKYATDINEKLVTKVAKDQKEALAKYQVSTPVQYVFMQHSAVVGSTPRPVDGVYQINICEVFYWPVKATIVSAHVNHSSTGATTLRMYSVLSQNTSSNLATSEQTPYSAANIKVDVPADTKIWFSLVSSVPLVSATLVLGVVFHPIDLLASSILRG
jgi:hypothetical protein